MSNKISSSTAKDRYSLIIDTMSKIAGILAVDNLRVIEISDQKMNEYKDSPESIFLEQQQTWFRIANRNVISIIESICYHMKQVSLLLCERSNKPLSEKQKEKLEEKKKNGSPFYLPTKDNLKFAFEMMAYAFDIKSPLKFGKEWATFLRVSDKRNDITHPKKLSDLTMTVNQHKDSADTFIWFENKLEEFFDELRSKKQANIATKL